MEELEHALQVPSPAKSNTRKLAAQSEHSVCEECVFKDDLLLVIDCAWSDGLCYALPVASTSGANAADWSSVPWCDVRT
eukprot:3940927-Rhodomonas_salina.3